MEISNFELGQIHSLNEQVINGTDKYAKAETLSIEQQKDLCALINYLIGEVIWFRNEYEN